MRPRRAVPTAVVLAALAVAAPAIARDGRKIFVSVDMEGIAGVVSNEQLGPPGFEYERFRQFMTEETNVALAAAREAGATEFVVSDSHGNMQNLLIEKLPKDVLVVRSAPRPLMMMQGLDESFDGVIFLGYHASTTNPEGVRAHTMSSATLADVRLNGVSVPEAAFNAAIAGHFGVPVLAISGDDVIVKEARGLLGDVEGAVVKWAYGFHSAKTLTPEAARDVIREKVKTAMGRRGSFRPYVVKTPVELEVRFKNYRPAEVLGYLPIVKRVDAHTVRFVGKDMIEVSRFMEFLLTYQPALEP
jgi:D-amino peptidase